MSHRAFSLTFLAALLAAGADWPQFLGPTRNGAAPDIELATSWPDKGPGVVWERTVGEGYAGPVVAGDNLILFHRVGDEDVVECLDAATGKGRWRSAYTTNYEDFLNKGNGPRSTPAVAAGKVFALGAGGQLTCLDLASGKQVWQRLLLKDYEVRRSFFGVGTSPLVEGDLVVINVGGQEGAGIVAFHKDTGKEVWKATDHDASYASPVAATIAGGRHLLFFTREGLVSLDPSNGSVRFSKRWRSRIDASVNAATPLVVGEEIFVSAGYATGALLVRAGKDSLDEIWKGDESLSCHFGTPVVKDGMLYGVDGRQEEGARLRCVEWKTGKVRWTQEGFGCGCVVAAGAHLLALSERGELLLLEATPERYVEKARAQVLAGPMRSHLALAHGRLYGRDARRLVCWDVKKGP